MTTHSFSIRDMISLIMLVAIFVSLNLAGCGGGVSEEHRMQNGTQVRGIQQGMVLYAQSNGGFYPGFNTDGTDDFAAVEASASQYGCNALTDDDIGKVYALLLTGEFFTPEYIVSPIDSLSPLTAKGKVDNTHYSYALLDMNDQGSNRRHEWQDTNNSIAPVVADPSSDIRPLDTISYQTSVSADSGNSDTDYKGNFAWNDNHVTFQTKALFNPGELKMGGNPNESPLNPFTNTDLNGAKFIW